MPCLIGPSGHSLYDVLKGWIVDYEWKERASLPSRHRRHRSSSSWTRTRRNGWSGSDSIRRSTSSIAIDSPTTADRKKRRYHTRTGKERTHSWVLTWSNVWLIAWWTRNREGIQQKQVRATRLSVEDRANVLTWIKLSWGNSSKQFSLCHFLFYEIGSEFHDTGIEWNWFFLPGWTLHLSYINQPNKPNSNWLRSRKSRTWKIGIFPSRLDWWARSRSRFIERWRSRKKGTESKHSLRSSTLSNSGEERSA